MKKLVWRGEVGKDDITRDGMEKPTSGKDEQKKRSRHVSPSREPEGPFQHLQKHALAQRVGRTMAIMAKLVWRRAREHPAKAIAR